MLDVAKKNITEASSATTKIDLTNFGLYDEDISELKGMLEAKPHITQIILTRNCLTEVSAETLAAIPLLSHISVGQNNFGSKGAAVLLAKENLNFLDLSGNSLDHKIAALIAKRIREGVKIVTEDNPDLSLDKPAFKEDPSLNISTVFFRTNEPTVLAEQRTSGDVVEKAFFERRRGSPEPADPKVEDSLLEQFQDYVSKHPDRSSELLRKLSSFCSSLKFGK